MWRLKCMNHSGSNGPSAFCHQSSCVGWEWNGHGQWLITNEITVKHCTHNHRLFSHLTRPQHNNSLTPLLTHETSNRFSNNQKHKQRQPFSLQHQKYVKLLIIVWCDAIQPHSCGGMYSGFGIDTDVLVKNRGPKTWNTIDNFFHEAQQSK